MSKTCYPEINRNMCIECGTCVANCKFGVFEKRRKPIIKDGDGCNESCTICKMVCPMGAIKYAGECK